MFGGPVASHAPGFVHFKIPPLNWVPVARSVCDTRLMKVSFDITGWHCLVIPCKVTL
jgi:hypothetical protein